MSGLGRALDDYLALRRGLGYKLERAGALLTDFVTYVERQGSSLVTTKLALDWATLPTDAAPSWKAARLCVVRGFAKYAQALDPRTEIPSQGLLPFRKKRVTPYLYSDGEIEALLTAARGIHSPLKACTYATLIGLLAVTGMRVGEAIALDRSDVDWDDKLLVVREGKLRKSRELPLHPTSVEALSGYAEARDRVLPRLSTPSFFVSQAGTRLIYNNVHANFLTLLRRAGLSDRRPRRPRIHDLRHAFALKTLLGWYRADLNVAPRLPLLSTYLGHLCPTNTYWYLTATPELLRMAAERRGRVPGSLP
jgi:integrase/recombinase XerD